MKTYTALKIIGGLLMILIGAWTVPVMLTTYFSSGLNNFIAICGCALMILSAYLESKGEI